MKRNKQGVSLIVLVITIIVMIILASAVMISLSSTNIFSRANEAVDKPNLLEVQNLAALAWSEAYIDKMEGKTVNIEERVLAELANYDITRDDYIIEVTDNGVEVLAYTLGNLIKGAEDYGKPVEYEANGVSNWQVFYEDTKNGYVFLATTEGEKWQMNANTTSLTPEQERIYKIFKLNETGYTLNFENESSRAAAYLVANFDSYANRDTYGKEYVVGALGAPTAELVVAMWNDLEPQDKINLSVGTNGYMYNQMGNHSAYASEGFKNNELTYGDGDDYDYFTWVASPTNSPSGTLWDSTDFWMVNETFGQKWIMIGGVHGSDTSSTLPIVCLKSSIPAKATADGYSLLK